MFHIFYDDRNFIPNFWKITLGKSIPEKIQNVTRFQISKMRFKLSEGCNKMIRSCLKYNPEDRLSIKQVLESDYIRDKCRELGWDLKKLMRFRKLRTSHEQENSMNVSCISDISCISGFTRHYEDFQKKHNASLLKDQSSEITNVPSNLNRKDEKNENGLENPDLKISPIKDSYDVKKKGFKKQNLEKDEKEIEYFEEKNKSDEECQNNILKKKLSPILSPKEDMPNFGIPNKSLLSQNEEEKPKKSRLESKNSEIISEIESKSRVIIPGLEMDYSQVNIFEKEMSDEDFEEKFFQDQLEQAKTSKIFFLIYLISLVIRL